MVRREHAAATGKDVQRDDAIRGAAFEHGEDLARRAVPEASNAPQSFKAGQRNPVAQGADRLRVWRRVPLLEFIEREPPIGAQARFLKAALGGGLSKLLRAHLVPLEHVWRGLSDHREDGRQVPRNLTQRNDTVSIFIVGLKSCADLLIVLAQNSQASHELQSVDTAIAVPVEDIKEAGQQVVQFRRTLLLSRLAEHGFEAPLERGAVQYSCWSCALERVHQRGDLLLI
mmetsp:Transcript_14014/g.41107  ORF Transcript_14014/g.41107 Transcript_14014/m.41107 type:complete len:229 (-) Transcript_14014:347-1033(-)